MIRLLNDKLPFKYNEKFFTYGPMISLFADIILIYYAVTILLPMTMTDTYLIGMIQEIYGTGVQVNKDGLDMMRGMTQTSVMIMFTGVFIFNIIVAYNVHKKSSISIKYLKGYTGSTIILSVFELGVYLFKLNQFNFYTFVTMILYGVVYLGLSDLTQKKEPQTSTDP